MIQSLKYVVTFNTTGRTLKNHLKFKPGITVITGENEAGKSFVLEMIRYSLFGTAALRGDRSDYDKLDVTLVVNVKGKKYTIVRSGIRATVNINEAVGTKAVNAFIVKLLGFGLDVFDIAGNANQGELDKLTKDMGPTERRKIIDDVTGLAQFEKAEKDCREESNNFRRIAEALEAQLVEPLTPAKSDDYEPSEVLKARLDAEIRNQTLRDNITIVVQPAEPVMPPGDRNSLDYEAERESWLRHRNSLLHKLNQLPEISNDYTEIQLLAFRAFLDERDRGPEPHGYSQQDLSDWRDAHNSLARESAPLYCGECGAIVTGRELPALPPLTMGQIDTELARQKAWDGRTRSSPLSSSPLRRGEIDERLQALAAQPERAVLEKQLQDMGPEPLSRHDEAQAWLSYDAALAEYERLSEAYHIFLTKKAELDALPAAEPFLSEKYQMALRYETLLSRYEALRDVYDTQVEQIEGAKQKRDAYKSGSLALKDARKEVKQYLVPSLSKVASALLTEMTDGERRHVFINEDFDIWVDKQPVRTLSGSGVSVVNLALRIALGQVLTQSVIPIFLADEIDANMGAKRTKATHDSLKRLRSKLKQIIVVTHKEFEGDHSLCLS